MKAKKRFGQHFLKDTNVVQQIVDFFNPQSKESIVEIGPGLGALTKPLLQHGSLVTVIEIDRDAIGYLHQSLGANENLRIVEGDALSFNYGTLVKPPQKFRCIGNLPYNISTPLLFHLFEFRSSISDMLFMLQKEVVDRLTAKPSTKDYGRLSVMAQYFCEIHYLFDVGSDAFSPPPKVNSAIVQLKPYQELPIKAQDFSLFETVVRDAFNLRRKTIANSLKSYLRAEDWQLLDINPTRRAETLSVTEFVNISNMLYALSHMRT